MGISFCMQEKNHPIDWISMNKKIYAMEYYTAPKMKELSL